MRSSGMLLAASSAAEFVEEKTLLKMPILGVVVVFAVADGDCSSPTFLGRRAIGCSS